MRHPDQGNLVVSRSRPRGPTPILRFCDESATNEICVNGLGFRTNGLRLVPIPIVTNADNGLWTSAEMSKLNDGSLGNGVML